MLRTTTASIATPLRSAANVTARRGYASHGPSYNAPSGYIFGEKVRRLADALWTNGKKIWKGLWSLEGRYRRQKQDDTVAGVNAILGSTAVGRGNTTGNRWKSAPCVHYNTESRKEETWSSWIKRAGQDLGETLLRIGAALVLGSRTLAGRLLTFLA